VNVRRGVLLIIVFVASACSLLLAQEKANSLPELAAKVDKHYNSLKSMKTQFVETYNGAGMSRTESGTLLLKHPGKMRWEYTEPRRKLFVSDGKTAWFYVPGEQQARKAPISKLDDIRSPLRFLLGKTKLVKEFNELGFAPNIKPQTPGDLVMRGSPKGMEDRVSLIVLEVSPEGRIDRILIEEVDGAMTEFRFTAEVENQPVADELFKFKPPAGVEIVEATELGF
jgi:outer membrane lipoprotein carrier protein